MKLIEAHKKYLEIINDPEWIKQNVGPEETEIEEALKTVGSNGYDLEMFKYILLTDDQFNQDWSFGCTADLTVDERMNLMWPYEWTFETDEDVHAIADSKNIPKRKIVE